MRKTVFDFGGLLVKIYTFKNYKLHSIKPKLSRSQILYKVNFWQGEWADVFDPILIELIPIQHLILNVL